MNLEKPSLLPLPSDRMACVIENAVRMMQRQEREGVPLWSIVGSLTGHGSGYSIEICRQLGFDPCQTIPRNFIRLKRI